MTGEVVPYEEKVGALTPFDVRAQVNLIQHILKEVMKKDEHYGVIPGTGTKPTLLKAGAEKLCLTFRLDPQYHIDQKYEGQHLSVVSKCTLYHIPTGQRFGSGMGSCSTRESKYAYRQAAIKCPACGKETVIKGKEEYGGGWVCFKKKGGCGAKFSDGDKAIESQPRGRVPNEDIADQYNTVLKMANKRSLVAAVLNATAASDIFTQDIEDMPQFSRRDDEDVTQQIQGVGKDAPQVSAPQVVEPPSSPSGEASAAADPSTKISQGDAVKLRIMLDECDQYAESKFREIAKIKALEDLPASDYAEAVDWVQRRAKRLGKAA